MIETLYTRVRRDLPALGDKLLSKDKLMEGKIVGYRSCTLEGCRGTRIGVRWPDGKLTWPCSKGCGTTEDGTWKVGFDN